MTTMTTTRTDTTNAIPVLPSGRRVGRTLVGSFGSAFSAIRRGLVGAQMGTTDETRIGRHTGARI